MANMIELNPYRDIDAAIKNFVETQWVNLKAMSLREHPDKLGGIREVAYTKAVRNSDGFIIGYINCHVLNDKYRAANFHTDTTKRRFPAETAPGQLVNTNSFVENFIDSTDIFELRVTLKQYENPNVGLTNVTFSSVFTFDGTSDEMKTALRTRDETSLMWKDPGFIIATRDYFDVVGPILAGWTPTVDDVTIQTLCQYGE